MLQIRMSSLDVSVGQQSAIRRVYRACLEHVAFEQTDNGPIRCFTCRLIWLFMATGMEMELRATSINLCLNDHLLQRFVKVCHYISVTFWWNINLNFVCQLLLSGFYAERAWLLSSTKAYTFVNYFIKCDRLLSSSQLPGQYWES
jgi:hypothetical protein